MNWYYSDAGNQTGPVDDAQFDALIQAGKIQPHTLVWREGLANWQPLAEARPAAAPASSLSLAPPAVAAGAAGGEVACSVCGRSFPNESVIRFGPVPVCGECKPRYVQSLREGVTPAGVMDYAGFWIRLGAKFVDGLILLPFILVPFALLGFFSTSNPSNASAAFAQLGLQLVIQLGYFVLTLCYNTFFLGKFGATPGKMALKLKVVMPDGAKLSYARAFGRSAAEILSSLVCNIGYLIAAFDGEKRAMHDHIASTRVVRK